MINGGNKLEPFRKGKGSEAGIESPHLVKEEGVISETSGSNSSFDSIVSSSDGPHHVVPQNVNKPAVNGELLGLATLNGFLYSRISLIY